MDNQLWLMDFADKSDTKSNHRNPNVYLHIYAYVLVIYVHINNVNTTLRKLAVYPLKKS